MKTFYKLLAGTLIVGTTNNFVWFALTFWVYLETQSVIATGLVGGTYMIVNSFLSVWIGSIVDHNKKKNVMIGSSILTLFFFSLGLLIYLLAPDSAFKSVASPYLWFLITVLLCGSVSGSAYYIVMPTLTTFLVKADVRDKANGMLGTIMGVSFGITSVASGLTLGFANMFWVFIIAILGTTFAVIYVSLLAIPEPEKAKTEQDNPWTNFIQSLDLKGTIKTISGVPGLFALIFFTTFNNLIGGVFMALMDAYGLSIVSVQVWGTLWGFLSMGFIVGGLIIAKKGLGKNPLITLFRINIVIWVTCIFFTIQPSLILLVAGLIIWITLVPFIEATEQTIIQKVVPIERQGRVFGFAHSVEQAASPLTAFLIGPVTQAIFIPFMTTGKGVELIGDWYGVGAGRGMALVFSLTGILGLIVTLVAMRTRPYKLLSERYLQPENSTK